MAVKNKTRNVKLKFPVPVLPRSLWWVHLLLRSGAGGFLAVQGCSADLYMAAALGCRRAERRRLFSHFVHPKEAKMRPSPIVSAFACCILDSN